MSHTTVDSGAGSVRPVRWGILGTGFIADLQASDLIEHGFTIQAVGSRNVASAAEFAAKFHITSAHGSYEDLVADAEVDVVYISTPHPFHYENALLALNAGKHVLIEKPFAMNAWQAREIVDLAESTGLVALEAMWTRYLPHMVRIRELVRSGALGEVRTVIADHNQNLPKDPLHRLNDPALGGGALLDLGIYPVSFAFDVFGAPVNIRAMASMTATGVDRQTAMIFEYTEGQQALLHCALDTAGPNRASIIGTGGSIAIDSVWYTPSPFTRYDAGGNVVERFDEPVTGRGMQYQAWELERLIGTGAISNDILSPRDSALVMATMDDVRRQIGLTYEGDRS
ncbi:putative dehydrogenase [Arthrobacter sp. V4I6]|uniref:Gfo/Idh/MocA family protein n=1 Tax=unclassified Arthrobacter TaxID=235627 RepID=UPI0027887A1A|nr:MULTISPECIES: Gfo/Idh/MocA family oxidoreductase [unclassified Arthrobacter]MDQ0821291.1 putative dehydrogenase [Arthrobacter sp. V1I7]MDQ0855555.1 putative dehydrogenase [Arthrobacter sp. V4I6]